MKQQYSPIRKLTVFVLMLAMFSPLLTASARAQEMMRPAKAKALTADQKILHVFNRLGFGARPGDLEKVRAMGLDKYIEGQFNPGSIDDRAAEARVRNLDILNMETSEIFAKYPNPGALLRMLEGNGRNNPAQNRNAPAATDEKSEQDQQAERRERRQKLAKIYQEYNLRPAGQILRDLTASRVLRAVYSERQLEEQMVDFWTNHFNVFAGKGAVRWYLPSYDRDVIRKNALGNFRDLLVGTAQHPAMLFYLDNFQSVSPDAQIGNNNRRNNRVQQMIQSGQPLPQRVRQQLKERFNLTDAELDARLKQMRQQGVANNQRQRRGINENYAREVMELHTLGVDGGYTQKDIQEVARAFTGWTIADPRGYRSAAANMIKGTEDRRANRAALQLGIPENIDSGEFYFNPRLHDGGEKTVLGRKINEGGIKDGLKVIDILVSNPATARFIARKLAVKFVSDNPSEALVGRVADAFHKSNGDIKTTLRAIFTSEEFFAPENYRAKIKTPFELLVSSFRALDADTNASPMVIGLLQKMGEPLYGYQAPTGYPDTAEDWVNTGALLERMNFAVALSSNRIRGARVDLKKFEATDSEEILSKAINNILSGEIAPNTRTTLLKQIEKPLIEPTYSPVENNDDDAPAADNPAADAMMMPDRRDRRGRANQLLQPSGNPEVFKVVGLLLGSPDFQRQ
ncbi:MAG: DUF1800 domain-containing protein [Pyrinomonadaceae bacterium]